jgi:DNA modification methylase
MTVKILIGDVREQLRTLPENSVHCIVTSPPYWGLRDYGVEGQIGLESSPVEFLEVMVAVFDEVRRVLRKDGTCWVNMGDSYAGANKGGNPTRESSTLQGGHDSQEASMVKRLMTVSRRRDDALIPRSDKIVEGLKPKDLVGMPWRLAFALQDAGWWLRQDIIWAKPNPMPESVRDRCTKAHEYIFLLTKSDRYFFDQAAISESISPVTHARLSQDVENQIGSVRAHAGRKTNGNMKAVGKKILANIESDNCDSAPWGTRNKRSVWTMSTQPFKEAHFATFPPQLPELCIKAGCPIGGTVLDPFFGAGTTGLVADRLQRDCIGIELNPAYAEIARRRIQADSTLFANVQV